MPWIALIDDVSPLQAPSSASKNTDPKPRRIMSFPRSLHVSVARPDRKAYAAQPCIFGVHTVTRFLPDRFDT